MNVWDLAFSEAGPVSLQVPAGHTTLLFVLKGRVEFAGGETLGEATLAMLDADSPDLSFKADADTRALLLTGEPLGEPIAAQGPFVMNTRGELKEAMIQFQQGAMGRL